MDNQVTIQNALPVFKMKDIRDEVRASTGLKGKALQTAVFSEMRRRNSAVIGMIAEICEQGSHIESVRQLKSGKPVFTFSLPDPAVMERKKQEAELAAARERAAAAEAELAALRASLPAAE